MLIFSLTSCGVTEVEDLLERDEVDVVGRVDGRRFAVNL